MKKIYLTLVALIGVFGCFQAQSDLVITEISYNPAESGTDSTEYIEVYNNGSAPIDLTGYTITNGVVFSFPSMSLSAGDYMVIAVDSMAMFNTYGYSGAYEWASGGLSNGGEPIRIADGSNNTIDTLRYDDANSWPTSPDGGGPSLVLCDPNSDNTLPANWVASATSVGIVVNGQDVYGSPGAADDACTPSCDTYATVSETACVSFTSPSGNYTWTSSGSYNDTIPNAAACDSIITVNLTINSPSTGTDVQTACDSYTWIDGNTYTANNSTATHTLTNAVGCDSVVTLNLTINSSSTGTDVQTACDSYTWIDGNTYTASNNTATHTLTNAVGCDSVVTLDLTIETVDVTTTQNGNVITANATGATYQWIDCDNGDAPIAGETNQDFAASVDGNYAVIVTEGNCTDTSDCVMIIGFGIDELRMDLVSMYPNPADEMVTLELENLMNLEIKILDVTGKQVSAVNIANTSKVELPVDYLSEGTYFIHVRSEEGYQVLKLSKQ